MAEVDRAILPKKSLSELRSKFCNHWRREVTDEEFIKFMREVTADEEHMPRNHRRNHLRRMFLASVGDEWYDIAFDTLFRLSE